MKKSRKMQFMWTYGQKLSAISQFLISLSGNISDVLNRIHSGYTICLLYDASLFSMYVLIPFFLFTENKILKQLVNDFIRLF